MKLWPYLMDLKISPPKRDRPLHLWLPLFLLWPLLAGIALLAFVVAIPLDVVLFLAGRPFHRCTLLVYRLFELLAETRGLTARVHADQNVIEVTLY